MKHNLTFKLTATAILSTMALITFLIESLFPAFIIPGARLGLANVFILLALILLGTKEACFVFLVKILLGSILSGNLSSMMYSLPSGVASFILQAFLVKKCSNMFTLTAISAVSAVLNSVLQNVVYVIVTSTPSLFLYLPYLVLLGFIAGITVGITCYLIIKFLPQKLIDKLSFEGELDEGQKR